MNIRQISADILVDIIYNGSYSNIAINKYLNKHDDMKAIDKNFLTQIVNGSIQNIITIDYIINKFSKTKVKKMKPFIACILRISVFQIKYLDRVPDSAICNEAVKIVKKSKFKGLAGFINGVLRNIIRKMDSIEYPTKKEPIKHLSVLYSYPEWMIKMWLNQYQFDKVEKICKAMNQTPELSLRVNTLKVSRQDLLNQLVEAGYEARNGEYSNDCIKIKKSSDVKRINGYKEGLFQVQDESSILVGQVANPSTNQVVLDVCAAPGGKATHIAQMMENTGKVIARDIHQHKLDLIESNAQRLGITNIEVELFDATQVDNKLIDKADIVSVDAPCSGLGIIRKKPDIKLKKDLDDIEELVDLQRKILKTASAYVKSKGVLIYSTCTINKEENIKNVEWFINNSNFELDSLKKYLPSSIDCDTMENGYVELLPSDYDTDGFFIARFIRKD